MAAPSKLNHVLIVGQSLAMGAYAYNVLSTNQPFLNRMFIGQHLDGGQPELPADDLGQLAPLMEGWAYGGESLETIASGFANWVASRVGVGVHDLLVSNCARGGTDYSGLERVPSGDPSATPTGTYPYLRGLNQVVAARQLVGANHYKFQAVLAVHGESDFLNTNYDLNIRAWQADYQADIRRLTGQTNPIPMFHSQPSSWGRVGIPERVWSPFKILDEYERHPDETVLVCPKYMLPYNADGLHLTSEGYRWLGEYYAKAYYHQIILGQQWSPLRPSLITRTNNVITVTFAGVVGPLAFDTNTVSNPQGVYLDPTGSPTGTNEYVHIGPYGFEYWDEVGSGSTWVCSTTITSVELAGTNAVKLLLNQTPPGVDRRLRYAFTPSQVKGPGITNWAVQSHGCLRDTDSTPSLHGYTLYNWCVHFDKPCP